MIIFSMFLYLVAVNLLLEFSVQWVMDGLSAPEECPYLTAAKIEVEMLLS